MQVEKSGSLLYRIKRAYWTRKKNKLGNRVNLKIVPLYADAGINIHHKGIIINGHIGKNCIFHGANCVGNKGYDSKGNELIPVIGSNVEFGYGSVVIGAISVADNVIIGAGSIVVKDIKKGVTVIGVSAREIE